MVVHCAAVAAEFSGRTAEAKHGSSKIVRQGEPPAEKKKLSVEVPAPYPNHTLNGREREDGKINRGATFFLRGL